MSDARSTAGGRGRSTRQTLTRERIVATALAILDVDSLEALTMRRLADALGAGLGTVYWHVPTKDALLDLVVEELLAGVLAAVPVAGDWRATTRATAEGVRRAVLAHPGVVPLLGRRPPTGPNARALGERLLGAFEASGFGAATAGLASASVIAWAATVAGAEGGDEPGLPGGGVFTFGLEALLDGIALRREGG